MKSVIEVQNLRKAYGKTVAVDGVSFVVKEGEIFGIVGPNGAGKTTTIECLEGLRKHSSGSVEVLGQSPDKHVRELHQRIGIQLQEANLPQRLKVWEALELFAAFYRRSVDWNQLITQLGLDEKRNTAIGKLSGGQKQRLFIALALVNDPELVFLDELTTGLDPHARRSMWDLVREIRNRGKTVMLTTHFMEEAERLCDRVAIMDKGSIQAMDTPENLVRSLDSRSRVFVTTSDRTDLASLRNLTGVVEATQNGDRLEVLGESRDLTGRLVEHLAAAGVQIAELRTEQASLEDVFLSLTESQLDGGEQK